MEPTYLDNPNVAYYFDIQQGSQEWLDFRKTKITATGAYEILQGRSIQSILEEKQKTDNTFTGNYFTERGHILEDEARMLYSELNSVQVQEVGIVVNNQYPDFACSPDGLVGLDGGIEIKAFQEERQEDVFQNLDPHIIAQIQFNLFITQRKWWDWILYNPEVSDIKNAYHCKRFYPDEEIFNKFSQALLTSDDSTVKETAIQIINLESQLRQQSEAVKAQIEFYNQTKSQIESLKQQLKQSTSGKIKETYTLGDDSLELSIYDTNKVVVSDESIIPEEYFTQTEIQNVTLSPDGKYYQKIPQTKLVNNLVKTGKQLPPGFALKKSRNISIKFNGQTL